MQTLNRRRWAMVVAVAAFVAGPWIFAATAAAPVTGKLYVVEVKEAAKCFTDENSPIIALTRNTVLKAEGSHLSTAANSGLTFVLSNGTGIACAENASLDVTQFSQDRILGPVKNLDKESSVSHSVLFITRGKIAITTPELANGSSLEIKTPHGSVFLRNSQVMIEVGDQGTTVSVISGTITVRSNAFDGGSLLEAGAEAQLLTSINYQVVPVQIGVISKERMAVISALVAESAMARQTVLFASVEESGELVPVKIVPTVLPVQFTVSPVRLYRD